MSGSSGWFWDKDSLISRAQIYAAMGKFAEARADLDAEEARLPPGSFGYVDMFTTSARLALRVGDFARAKDAYSRAIERSPVHYWYYMERALADFHLGEYDQSLADIKTSIELNPTPQPLLIISSQLIANCPDDGFRDDLLALAESRMEKCKELQFCLKYAGLLCACGLRDRAEGAYEKAIELWLRERDQKAADLGVYQEVAERRLQNAFHLHLYQFAVLQLSQGKPENARQTCDRMLDHFGGTDDPGVANFVAWSCALAPDMVQNFDSSIALARMAVNRLPESTQYRKTLGAILYRAGRHEEALHELTELAKKVEKPVSTGASSPAYTWYFLAMTHQALGHADDARQWLAKANDRTDKVLSDNKNPAAWNRKLTLRILRDEANSQINPDKSTDGTEPKGDSESPSPSVLRDSEIDK